MAIIISQGSGATVATESISGQHYGYNKITDASLGGSATVGMIVDSSANASGAAHVFMRGNLTLSDPKGFIGLVTVTGNVGVTGNVTLTDSKAFIGLVTIGGMSTVTLADPKGFIGLVTTVDARPLLTSTSTVAGYISTSTGYPQLVTPQFQSGNRWAETSPGIGQVAVMGNVTLSDPKTFIGLVTIGGLSTMTLSDPKGFIGLVTIGGMSSVTLSDPKGFIGLITIGGMSQVTLSDPKGFIGLVTIGGMSSVTLSDPKGFIGLVTTVPTYMSGYTSLATVISASGAGGLATIVIPPSGQKIFVKDIHISSLGRAEVSAWGVNIATATICRIPWTALSTTGGFVEFYGDNGSQWGQADDGLTFALNGAGTIGVMANVRFA